MAETKTSTKRPSRAGKGVNVWTDEERAAMLASARERKAAAGDEHDEREPQVQGADVLVIGRHDPAHDPAGMMLVRVLVTRGVIVWNAAHRLAPV